MCFVRKHYGNWREIVNSSKQELGQEQVRKGDKNEDLQKFNEHPKVNDKYAGIIYGSEFDIEIFLIRIYILKRLIWIQKHSVG